MIKFLIDPNLNTAPKQSFKGLRSSIIDLFGWYSIVSLMEKKQVVEDVFVALPFTTSGDSSETTWLKKGAPTVCSCTNFVGAARKLREKVAAATRLSGKEMDQR